TSSSARGADSVSKWFAYTLKRIGIRGKKALHSFRGTVISRLHTAGVKGETVRALTGHAGVDVHETVYLHLPLSVLKEAVEKLDYGREVLKGLPTEGHP
ncbi:MAG TPA: hypothetical protein VJV04_13800, partial [Nitrospiraceae bacterium]|nr:hypothetical protein [Nitrospiraceae bacterium]